MELFSYDIKNFRKRKPRKKIPYISGKGNPKKASRILGNETFQSTPEKNSYTSGKRNPEKISYIFSKESFSYILGKVYLEL